MGFEHPLFKAYGMIITIDGTAGSGKSTVAARLAKKLSVAYLDTGAMYRAITWAALQKEVSLDDALALNKLAQNCRIEFLWENNSSDTTEKYSNPSHEVPEMEHQRIWLDGKEVTLDIRSTQVTESAYKIAQNPHVRVTLVQQQREIAKRSGTLVTEGRDQGTVAFPDADYKFYLDAACPTRAKRRWLQLKKKGINENYKKILKDLIQRDHRDRTRKVAPLAIPLDAIKIDSTNLPADQVVETLYRYIKKEQLH